MQMRLISWVAKWRPSVYTWLVRSEFGELDREVYDRLGLAGLLTVDRNEAYRQEGVGVWYDAMIPGNWEIPLGEIRSKVYLWHGEQDATVPPAMGRYFARELPDCEAVFIKQAGHFWILEHVGEVLDRIARHERHGCGE
jgi:pimeloyl-ACP methyl ester carboxylesterase